jgi:superfamily II DNA or RNA helicase
MPDKFFKDFYVIFGDECHLFKSKSLTSIMTKLRDCPYRVGTTGTLDDVQVNKLVIQGLFGSVYKVTTTTELIEQNMLSNLKINCILLEYSDAEKKEVRRAKYQEEMDWLVKNDKRNNFIIDLSLTLKGNTLVLFQFVEKHGKILYSSIESKTKNNRKVFFVYGGTDVDVREEIRHIVEKEDDAIIVASYGTFSTGISIRKLHNIIFASPSKSRIRILQSIGRQLRKSEHKVMANLYDIGDNLRWKSWKNHTLRHFVERIKIYNSENFEYKTDSIKL